MPERTCIIDGCPEPVMVKKRGLCQMHYHRWHRHGDPLYDPRDLRHRFEALVDRSGGPDACHPWLGAPNAYGYGRIKADDGKARPAQAVAWELATGQSVPSGWHVDHECHNRAVRDGTCRPGICAHRLCCNERHLVPREQREHMSESVTWHRKGSAINTAKLTEADKPVILAALASGVTGAALARSYSVSGHAISCIKLGKTWKHI